MMISLVTVPARLPACLPTGIVSTLSSNGKYSDGAAAEVQRLADQLLKIYDFDRQGTVLSLHNNGGSYGASSYLPGGAYAQDAAAVFIAEGSNPSDFLFVVDPAMYAAIASQQYNVVLQNNATVTNDGSLSYYSGLRQKPYINFEAQSEAGAAGNQVVIQLDMIQAVQRTLLAASSTK